MAGSLSLAELLDGHVTLDVECFDRLYCNLYVPTLQTAGGTVRFLHDHRGNPIPSPALFRPMGEAYRKAVLASAEAQGLPILRFSGHERKLDLVTPYFERTEDRGWSPSASPRRSSGSPWARTCAGAPPPAAPTTRSRKVDRRVTVYYHYLLDEQWAPA